MKTVEREIARESNLELLRIIAILFVLIDHADFYTLGHPAPHEISLSPFSTSMRFIIQSFTSVCVNVFIFISGWFGITPRLKRFCGFIFQIWFMKVFLHIFFLILGREEQWDFSLNFVLDNFFYGNWFILSYIVLYAISPMLNIFIENVSQHQFKIFLCLFFLIQTLFGFIHDAYFFHHGYSPLTFMGLYLLARYVRLYPNLFTTKSFFFDLGVYILMSCITTLCAIVYTEITGITDSLFYAYSSPFIIIAALYFFLLFTKVNFRNRLVNWIANSAFAAFLLHMDKSFFIPYYYGPINRWFLNDSSPIFLLKVSALIFIVFVTSIVVDKVREYMWNILSKHIFVRNR